ncbi:rCG35004, partial [Rattus norvegicus]
MDSGCSFLLFLMQTDRRTNPRARSLKSNDVCLLALCLFWRFLSQ